MTAFLVIGFVMNIPPVAVYFVAAILLSLALLTISLDLLLITLIFIRPSLDILGNIGVQIANDAPLINIAGMTALVSIVLSSIIIRKRKLRLHTIPLGRFILIFLGVHILFVPVAIDIPIAINEVVRVTSFLLVFFAGYALVDSREDFQLLLRVFIFSSIIPALVASLELITGQGIYSNPGFDNRIMGTFGHPNVLGYYLLLIIALIVYQFFDHQIGKKNRDLMLLYTGVLGVLLINTYTRGAWIGLFFLVVGVLLIKNTRKTLRAGAIIVPTGGAMLVVYSWLQNQVFFNWPRLAGIPIVSRLLGLFSGDPSDSILWRQQMWGDMLEKGLERPLIGFGTGMVEIVTEEVRGIALGALETHNDYIKVFVEMGVIGFLSFLLLGIATVVLLSKKLQSRNDTLVLMIIFITLALYLSAVYDNILRQTAVMWIFFALLGMVMKYVYSIRDFEDNSRLDIALDAEKRKYEGLDKSSYNQYPSEK